MSDRITLKSGSHDDPAEGGCVMEVVSMLAKQPWTDSPTCTNEVITRAAQAVNDRLNDTDRQRLVALIPRILRARRTDSDRRVNVRLAAWAARSVLHLVREKDRELDREACELAIRAVELCLAGEATAEECQAAYAYAYASYASAASADAAYAAYASAASADAAYAAYACASAGYAYAYASAGYAASSVYAAYAASAAAAAADVDPVAWLDSLLDVWEKAVNEEGEALWVPTEWEDEALAFLAERNQATS